MKLPDEFMFVVCLLSAIPLAYYIGLALSRYFPFLLFHSSQGKRIHHFPLPSSLPLPVYPLKHRSPSEQY